MRSIAVSTDVYARIWALREPGEETEDAILRRELSCLQSSDLDHLPEAGKRPGYYDARHRVAFPEGFEVFRTYMGEDFRAHARGGTWLLLNDGVTYGSLNELSRAIGAKTENAWVNWYFRDECGNRRVVSDLRDPSSVSSRSRGHVEQPVKNGEVVRTSDVFVVDDSTSDGTWRDDVRSALERLGSRASLGQIYRTVETIRRAADRSVPPTLEATIRRTLEDHSSQSQNYRGGLDLFCMPEGKGAGVWALNAAN
jgi:hypothetical protein